LIVEDNPTARVSLERILIDVGFVVESAGTLGEGHAKLDGHGAVILDLDLPDGNGIDLLRRIRAEKRTMKVLIATADSESPTLREVVPLAPDAIFIKPVDVRKIVGVLQSGGDHGIAGQ
jgi:DNA-binding response OmpR family regulator